MVASIWQENILGYLSTDIICSEKHTIFLEHKLRKIVFIIPQIFFTTHMVLKIGE